MSWLNDNFEETLARSFYGNTAQQWLIALGVALVALLAFKLIQILLISRLHALTRQTDTKWDDIVTFALRKTKVWFLVVLAIFVGAAVPELSGDVRQVLRTILVLAALLQGGIWMNAAFTAWLEQHRKEQLEEDAASVTTMSAVGLVARIALWSTIVLLALDNLGIDVTALVTGLGVGGVAVALALQNILGDLFSSLSIALDKPFVLGDFVVLGDEMGTIERIGIKTTRVRSLSGEQLVFSNGDLISSRIRNYGRMFERRVLFKIGVTYGTPRQSLEAIPEIIRKGIEQQDTTRFDRCHFSGYGDFSLDFETVYYVLDPDYSVHMDIRQAINLHIYSEFEKRGIEFAFPTQTIYLERSAEHEESTSP